jgi:hypothetical protein
MNFEEASTAALNAQAEALSGVVEESMAVKKQIEEATESVVGFEEEIKEATAKTNIFAAAERDAAEEARNFAGGMGGSATGALAFGVAMVFAATKVKELTDKFADTAKEFAKFDIATRTLAKTSLVGDHEELEHLRTELALTKREGLDFFNALADGARQGVASTEELVAASRQLRDAFGDDPTERLKTYIDLLKEIPTLETDISLNASMDDQTAAWFALAEKGKVSQAIELQMAGLLGGDAEEAQKEIPEGDREILKAMDRAEHLETDIANTIASSMPPMLLEVGKLAGTALAIGGSTFGAWVAARAQVKLLTQIWHTLERQNLSKTAGNLPGGGGVGGGKLGKVGKIGALLSLVGLAGSLGGGGGGAGGGGGREVPGLLMRHLLRGMLP